MIVGFEGPTGRVHVNTECGWARRGRLEGDAAAGRLATGLL